MRRLVKRNSPVIGWVSILLLAAIFSGCAPRLLSPPVPPLNLNGIDTTPLHGKRIVIDPGHGGIFTGAVGVHGLRESDVNLAVGLVLWGLLKEAGAEPILTRSADVSRISPESRGLKDDLDARVEITRRYEPDLFVSIHHNSDTDHRRRNETELYYQMSNPGASRNLADALAGAIGARGAAEDIRIFPGNFYVLRHNPVTAVLGEGSFMSNKPNERRLSLHGYLRLEGEAYFLGILDYFRKGVPQAVYPMASTKSTEIPRLEEGGTLEALLEDPSGIGIDPASLRVTLDGLPVPFRFDPGSGRVSNVSPGLLPNGVHFFRVLAANRNGQETPVRDLIFQVARPPAAIQLALSWTEIPADGETLTRFEVRVQDRYGLPVADGTPIRTALSSGELLDSERAIRGGSAVGHFRAPGEPGEGVLRVESGEAAAEAALRFGPPSRSLFYGQALDQAERPIDGVILEEEGSRVDQSDPEGLLFYQGRPGVHRFVLSRNGYYPREISVILGETPVREDWKLVPREGGVLLGKKIILDIEGDETQRMEIIRELVRLLEGTGASVIQILRSDSIPMEERVLMANRTEADLLLSFSAEDPGRKPSVQYYYNSTEGKRLAKAVAESLEGGSREGGHFMVVYTGMTAIRLDLPVSSRSEQIAAKIYRGIVDALPPVVPSP